MTFEGEIVVRAPLAAVWEFFTQVDKVARCVPGCQSVEPIDAGRYKVVITETLGIFRVSFTTEAQIESMQQGESITASVIGNDRKLGSGFRQTLQSTFAALGPAETRVRFTTDVQFSGKIAGLGYGIIIRKADDALVKFGQNVRAQLEAAPTAPPQV